MARVSASVSARMASIKPIGNQTTEVAFAKLLRVAGLRGYRKHWRVVGRPDFAWPALRIAVFVDGCFWHGCRCKAIPRSNRTFWLRKFSYNKRHDRQVTQTLRRTGWIVIRVRECMIRKVAVVKRVRAWIERRRKQQEG